MRIDLSAKDSRIYRFVTLDNELRAILVSGISGPIGEEEEADVTKKERTAWALSIPLGAFTDPDDAVGLSDLLRRTLVQEIREDLLADDQMDAYTTNEWTLFYFEVEPKRLCGTMEIFVKHLNSPKLEVKHIDAQLDQVDLDYKRAKGKDEVTLRYFIGNLTTPDSPFRKTKKSNRSLLLKNNARTIGDLRSMMHEHLMLHLATPLMTFAVESTKDTLDGLEMAVQQTLTKFNGNKRMKSNNKNSNYSQHANCFECPDFCKFYEVIPVREKEQLRMIWTVPSVRLSYRSNPMLVLENLIKNLQEGSLAYYLEENHLATELECTFGTLCDFTNSSVCTLVMMRMNLTQTGIRRVPMICCAVYKYLKFLKTEAAKSTKLSNEQNPWEFLWNDNQHTFLSYVRELQVLLESRFINHAVLNPQVTVVWLAAMLRTVAPEDVYSGYALIKEPDIELYHELLERIASHPCCIIQCSHMLESNEDRAADLKIDPWHQFKYAVNEIPASVLQCIENPDCDIAFSLPARNRTAAEQFPHLPCANGIKLPENLNAKLGRMRYEEYGALWFQPLTYFQHPKGTIFVQLSSNTVLESVRNSVLLMLFAENVRQSMDELQSIPLSKGMTYNTAVIDNEIHLKVSGPSHNLRDFYCAFISHAFQRSAKMDLDQFDQRRIQFKQWLNRKLASPENLADNLLHFLTRNTAFLLTDQIEDFARITIADLMAFTSQLLCQLQINSYVAGSVSVEDAESMYNRTVRVMNCVPSTNRKEAFTVPIRPGTYRFRTDSRAENNAIGCFVRYSFCMRTDATAEAMNRILLEIFNNYVNQFFCIEETSAKTVQFRLPRSLTGPRGHSAIQLNISFDEPGKTEDYWFVRSSAFWYKVAPVLVATRSETELEDLRNAVTANLKQISRDPEMYTEAMWDSIVKDHGNFDFNKQICASLKRLTKDELFNFFFHQYLDVDNQRSIILEITPSGSKQVTHKLSFRRQFFRTNDGIDAHISKFFTSVNINPQSIDCYKEQFKVLERLSPERVKTIHDPHVFRNQCLNPD